MYNLNNKPREIFSNTNTTFRIVLNCITIHESGVRDDDLFLLP